MSKENKINYEELEKITVTSQSELDMIPDGFEGRIYIESGVRLGRAVVLTRVFPRPVIALGNAAVKACGKANVVARGNTNVKAYENASVRAYENASVEAYENACIEALGNTSVEAWENSYVIALGNTRVKAWGKANVIARGNASVEAWKNAHVEAYENAHVEARGNVAVKACGKASVEAWKNAHVEAYENASVEAWGNACIEAGGNVRVIKCSSIARIQISGNARIVYHPKNIEDFMNFYGIKHDKKTAIFYKAVHRREVAENPPVECQFVSDYMSVFEYPIGSIVSAKCDPDISNDCSYGIHISYLEWAIDFGCDWSDMAIIEVETKIKDIILPTNTNGNVRTSEVKVLREVPLEECGVFGKILARKRDK